MSIDIEQASEALLKALGGNAEVVHESELASQLYKNITKVLKMEKSNQVMKALIDSLSAEIKKKDEIIQRLQHLL